MPEEKNETWLNQAAKPILALLFLFFLLRWLLMVSLQLNQLPEDLAAKVSDWIQLGSYLLFSLSCLLGFVMLFAWPAPEQVADHKSSKLWHFDLFRSSLALFFVLYAFVVAKGMIPLPDEPPRINKWGLFCVTLGLVIAFHCLVSRYRLFLFSIWMFYLWSAQGQMEKRIKFLEMMLEPRNIEVITYHGLGLVFLLLLLPKSLKTFNKSVKAYHPTPSPVFRKGFPF